MTCPRCHGQHWILQPPNGTLIYGKCKRCAYPATWPAEPRTVHSTLGQIRRKVADPQAVGREQEA